MTPAGRKREGGAATPRLFVLLGDPVAHSLSPALQNAAFQAAGVRGVYLPLRTGPEDLAGLLRGIARGGGGGNVTLPHKEAAFAAVEEATPVARRTGAVNTFWFEGGRVRGDNTDVEGVREALEALHALPEEGRGAGRTGSGTTGGTGGGGAGAGVPEPGPQGVLVLGAGGAARAVLAALEAWGPGGAGRGEGTRVHLWNRTEARARELAEAFRGGGLEISVLPEAPTGALPVGVVVNATRLGLDPDDPLPITVSALPRGSRVLDLVYSPRETPWVHAARAAGHPAMDGGTMLVAQGAAAFRRWWGEEPPISTFHAVLEGLREGRDA